MYREKQCLPEHLGVIMDGNRRWARKRGLPIYKGHLQGYQKLKQMADWCIEVGIPILTVYAFSTENWNRTPKEVEYLMQLIIHAFTRDTDELHKKGVKIRIIGQKNRFSEPIQSAFSAIEEKTLQNTRLLLQIAVSYGGRAELLHAIKQIIAQGISQEQITEEELEKYLWTTGTPDPNLILRTSGEQRLSGFLIWQAAYSELIFTKKNWPSIEKEDFLRIIGEYSSRQRRFGK